MTARAVVALLVCPLSLLTSFVATGLVLMARGASPDELGAALEASPTVPVVLGFGLALVVTMKFARRDGFSLRTLGWQRPGAVDWLIAAFGGGAFVALNTLLLFPAVAAQDPSFDPSLSTLSLPAALLTFVVAVAAEETIYRGYALELLRTKHSAPLVVVLTSVGYALLAPGTSWAPKAWAFFFGLALASLRWWRGTSWPGALIHLAASLAPKLLS